MLAYSKAEALTVPVPGYFIQRDRRLSDAGNLTNKSGPALPIHMVTSREVASDQIHSDRLQQIESSNTGCHESISNKKESPLSVLPAKVLCKSNLEGSSLSITDDKELDTLHQRQNPDTGIHSSQSNQDGSSLSTKLEKEMNNLQKGQSPDTGICAPESNQEGGIRSIVPSKLSDNLQQRHDQEKFTLSIRPEKVLDKLPLRRNPDIGVHTLQSDQEGKSPSVIPDKPSEDGYNWRKYGQKLVRGNKFIRSYYKCTFPNCSAKKQVERSHDGHITEIKYLRKHEHPKPQRSPQMAAPFVMPIQARRADEPSLTIPRDQSSDVHGDASHHIEPTEIPQHPIVAASDDVSEVAVSHSNKMRDEVDSDGDPDLKRQKIETSSVDEALVNKMNGEPRLVVETRSEVDIVNDGYRWRKYGQKLVKGNPNPRSYYRCSTAGCPVKKHVERASHDPKVVITTYEGQHDHDVPSGRFVTHNTGAAVETTTTAAATTTTSLSGESRSEQEEKKVVCRDLVVGVSSN